MTVTMTKGKIVNRETAGRTDSNAARYWTCQRFGQAPIETIFNYSNEKEVIVVLYVEYGGVLR